MIREKMLNNPVDNIYEPMYQDPCQEVPSGYEIMNHLYKEKQDKIPIEIESEDSISKDEFNFELSSLEWKKNKNEQSKGIFNYGCGFKISNSRYCTSKPYNTGKNRYWGLCKKHYILKYEKKLNPNENQFELYLNNSI